LNAFNTSDKGLVYVDATGNAKGTGTDDIAYAEKGKRYGTMEISKVSAQTVDCSVGCSEFSKSITYTNHSSLFSYDYFLGAKECMDLYSGCVNEYNDAVGSFHAFGGNPISTSELNTWSQNLAVLAGYVAKDNTYIVSEWEQTVDSIEIYW